MLYLNYEHLFINWIFGWKCICCYFILLNVTVFSSKPFQNINWWLLQHKKNYFIFSLRIWTLPIPTVYGGRFRSKVSKFFSIRTKLWNGSIVKMTKRSMSTLNSNLAYQVCQVSKLHILSETSFYINELVLQIKKYLINFIWDKVSC